MPQPNLWRFGFRFFKQVEYFGLDSQAVDAKWFVHLIEQFKSLGEKTVEELMQDRRLAKYWRFHMVEWKKYSPYTSADDFAKRLLPSYAWRGDLNIRQFKVTDSKGRVVGFFDHEQVFQVVLLDPEHNIQPTQRTGFKPTPTKIL